MKCYNHPEVDAVARCSVCSKLLCRQCVAVVGGKRYCKPHAERMLARERRLADLKRKGLALDIAVVLAVLDGVAGVVVGFLLILLGLLAPSAQGSQIIAGTVKPFLDYFANVLLFPSLQALAIGFALMVLGISDVVAGYYLWGRSRPAALLSVAATSIAGGLIGGYLIVLALAGVFLYVYVASALIKIGAIGYGWSHLKGARVPPDLREPPHAHHPGESPPA